MFTMKPLAFMHNLLEFLIGQTKLHLIILTLKELAYFNTVCIVLELVTS